MFPYEGHKSILGALNIVMMVSPFECTIYKGFFVRKLKERKITLYEVRHALTHATCSLDTRSLGHSYVQGSLALLSSFLPLLID